MQMFGLLCLNEAVYLSFDDNAAGLLCEVGRQPPLREQVINRHPNRPFKEWNEVFPRVTWKPSGTERRLALEFQPQSNLHDPGIVHRGYLTKCGRRADWICSRSEDAVVCQVVAVIQGIKAFSQSFDPQSLGKPKRPTQSHIEIKEISARACVAINETAVHRWPCGCTLNRIRSGGDVEGKRRVVLKHCAQLDAKRNVGDTVENEPVPLVVVGTGPVPPNVERIDWTAKEEFADIVQGLRMGVRDAITAPPDWPLDERDVEAVIFRIRLGFVLAIVGVGWIGTAAVVGTGSDTGWNVLVDGNDEMETSYMLVADAKRAAISQLMLDLNAALIGVCVLNMRIHGGEVNENARGQGRNDVGEDWRASLCGRQTNADLTGTRERRRVVAAKQSVGEGAQWHAIVE